MSRHEKKLSRGGIQRLKDLESYERDSYYGKKRTAAPSSFVRAAEGVRERYWRGERERCFSHLHTLSLSLAMICYFVSPALNP